MRRLSVPELRANAAKQHEDNGPASPAFSKIQHVAGFPNLIEPREHNPPDIYCRALSMLGNGFPTWIGYTPQLPEPYSKRSVEVGDVGYLNEWGNFVFVFNLFLPSNDPLNQMFTEGFPEGYFPLEPPTDNEILRIPDYFLPGSVIVSNGVDVTRVSESPPHLKFKSSEPEAVALSLPGGASREEFKGISRFQEYINTHAERWIQYFNNGKVPYRIPNGGIYIITGCDKAPSFSAAIFPRKGFLGSRCTSFEFSNNHMHCGPQERLHVYQRDGPKGQEYCLFIRGIKLALSDPEWNWQVNDIPPEDTPISSLPSKPPTSDNITPPKTDKKESIHQGSDVSNNELSRSTNRDGSNHSTDNDPDDSSTDSDDNESNKERQVRVRNYPFHPSDLILQVMFSKHPDARLALVDDYIWSRFANIGQDTGIRELSRAPLISRCMQSSFISDWGSLMEAIFKSHIIVETDEDIGVPPTSSKIQHVAGFPNLIEPRQHTASNIYCRTLLMSGNGFPLWIATRIELPQPYSKRTVEVGDVGYINDSGTFIFVFNLFHPSKDPLNQLFQMALPEGYVPLDPPTDNEILRIPEYFPPGSVIATNGVDVTRVSDSPLHLKFRSSEQEAVVLVLQNGASREDLKDISRLQGYLMTHAESWVRHLNNGRQLYSVPNGGLYVITGCDKAPTYSTAIFPYKHFLGSRHTSFEFSDNYMQPASKLGIVSYEGRSYGADIQEHCLFIRGIRIALSDLEWNVQIDEIHSDDTPVSQLPSTPPISDLVIPAKIDDEEPLQLEAGINNKEMNHSIDSDSVNSDIAQNNNVEVRNVFQNGPQLNLLSQQRPDAKLAFVDDYTWSRFAKTDEKVGHGKLSKAPLISRCMQSGFISDWGTLLEAMFKSCLIVETDGILNLQSNNLLLNSWFDKLRKRLRSRRSPPEPVWDTDIILDLVRQGESIRGPGEKFQINYS
ncbi:hypothetical protein JR316_0006023 [Psilocybe cubensis]|uniref:Uncharacterized protein n=2 Tax=Psilocybe cubensis TaxID=181762 RepID=A0ACB8H1Y5_PSICU|nr:hypothetical protein JR316_0006023 [Psilocybe cubensis]KAH9481496.1 hypothetical protein JR316_0006023 [Psilocybe cubensis]